MRGEFVCGWLPRFALQAAARGWTAAPAAVYERNGPLELVVEANAAAAAAGVRAGMATPRALGRCPGLRLVAREREAEARLTARLLEEADHISPRVQAVAPGLVVMDFAGLRGLHGSAAATAARWRERLGAEGWGLRTGIAAHPATALMAAKTGLGELAAGEEGTRLAPLGVALLGELGELTETAEMPELLGRLERWGIRTLGELARLPAPALAARLGKAGPRLQAIARGQPEGLLNTPPRRETETAAERVFEPPTRDLERVKAAVSDTAAELAGELEAHDRVVERAALELHGEGPSQMRYPRQFAAPTRETRTIAAQFHLELERRRPVWAVAGLRLEYMLARPRRMQTRLFAAARPDAGKLPKLLGRLGELPGEAGSPRLTDTHQPGAFTMAAYAPPETDETAGPWPAASRGGRLALRRFRPARELRPGEVKAGRRAGPWRSTGQWWRDNAWAWDEWDAELPPRGDLPGGLYRLRHDLATRQWFIVGRYD